MVRNILERSLRMLSKNYGSEYSIEILVAIIYWKVKNESIPIDNETDKNKLIQIISKLVIKESNNSEIGSFFLDRLKSMDEDSFKDIINIIQFIFSIELVSYQSKQELLSEFIEVISFNTKFKFDYFTPTEVVKLMQNKNDSYLSFYDPYKRSGELLVDIYKNSKNKNLLVKGKGGKHILNQIEQLRFTIHKVDKSIINTQNSKDKFDLIITNPPFGKTENIVNTTESYWDNYISSSKRNEFQFLKHCLNKINDKGKIVIVLPDNFLFSNELKKFREKAIIDSIIKKIILLPKVFYGTMISACIVEFNFNKPSKNSVIVIDLRNDFTRIRNREVIPNEIIQEVKNNSFKKDNNPNRYRFFKYKDFKKYDFDFQFIKETSEITSNVNFDKEMEKLIIERKQIIKQLEEAQSTLNKIIF